MKVIGTIKDAKTNNPLAFANVYYSNRDGTPDYKNIGTTSSQNGKYDLGSEIGSLHITASYVGYKRQTKPLPTNYQGSNTLNFELTPIATTLAEVEITATRTAPLWKKAVIATIISGLIYAIYRLMKPKL